MKKPSIWAGIDHLNTVHHPTHSDSAVLLRKTFRFQVIIEDEAGWRVLDPHESIEPGDQILICKMSGRYWHNLTAKEAGPLVATRSVRRKTK